MPGPTLQTLSRRSLRTAAARRRRRALAVVGGAVTLTLVLGTGGWAVYSAGRDGAASSTAGAPAQAAQTAPTSATAGKPAVSASAATAATSGAKAPAATRPATVTVAAVGDMIFDRRVKTLIANEGGAAPLARVASRLRKADIAIGNLESPLSDGGKRNAEKDVTFRGDPRAIEGLKASGFDFLALANNHVLDYGPKALADSISLLDDAGIGHAGAGKNQSAAWKPAVVETGERLDRLPRLQLHRPSGLRRAA